MKVMKFQFAYSPRVCVIFLLYCTITPTPLIFPSIPFYFLHYFGKNCANFTFAISSICIKNYGYRNRNNAEILTIVCQCFSTYESFGESRRLRPKEVIHPTSSSTAFPLNDHSLFILLNFNYFAALTITWCPLVGKN